MVSKDTKAAPPSTKQAKSRDKRKKKKGSKEKKRMKINDEVLVDQTYDKPLAEVPEHEKITLSVTPQSLSINGSLAKRALKRPLPPLLQQPTQLSNEGDALLSPPTKSSKKPTKSSRTKIHLSLPEEQHLNGANTSVEHLLDAQPSQSITASSEGDDEGKKLVPASVSSQSVPSSKAQPTLTMSSEEEDEGGAFLDKEKSTQEPSSVVTERKLFQRVWSVEDEVLLLKNLLDFKNQFGKEPSSSEDFLTLYESIKDSLDAKINKEQMMSKRLVLRKKYKKNMEKVQLGRKLSGNECAPQCYELAEKLWGAECAKPGTDKANEVQSKNERKTIVDRVAAASEIQAVHASHLTDLRSRLADELKPNWWLGTRIMVSKTEKLTELEKGYIKQSKKELKLNNDLSTLESIIIETFKAGREPVDTSISTGSD